MQNYQIKNRLTGAVIFEGEAESLRLLVIFAVSKNANLRDANLCDADLCGANLSGADLSGADLSGADLSSANLSTIRNDFWDVLLRAQHEVKTLREKIISGGVDGSCYEGSCACLVGTIANAKGIKYNEISGISPDSSRPIERFFMGIKQGDMPENNNVSKIVLDWVDEWLKYTSVEKAANV